MRITFVSQPRDRIATGFAASGSVGIVVCNLAAELAHRHEITVIAPRGAGEAAVEQVTDNLRLVRIGPPWRLLHDGLDFLTGLSSLTPAHTESRLYYAEYFTAVARALAADPPEVVVLETVTQAAPRLKRAAPEARLFLHAHDPRLVLIPHYRNHVGTLDGVVTVSDYLTRAIEATHPGLPVRTIGNGVDPSAFLPAGPGSDGARVINVGRVSPEKGLHVLMQAMNNVLERRADARLELVGSPGLLPYTHVRLFGHDRHWMSLDAFYGRTPPQRFWNQLVRKGPRDYVDALERLMSPAAAAATSFAGHVRHADLPARYAGASLFVLPSICDEPFGIPLVEAMAAGLPVVATRTGGIPEIVADGETGLLVERGDADGLASAILALLGDPERRLAMGRAGRERVARLFTWSRSAERLEAALA
ncbi:MAG TPA: glycosyltransferase family 4 protein [Geminicoccaceae bacterium]|nr:glycosyltransferase family 4 protein [Geminicoccus sp.]HMU50582.1 glycosyltransferase family 4 protein [Geminicoccaceae bacterium]